MNLTAKLKDFFAVQDMTKGKPMTGLLKFSIPLLVGNLAQQLYNTVDSIIVGRYIGDVALSAVGTSGPIINLLLVLFMGIATGASILSAQFFGAGDRKTLDKVVGSSILLTVVSGLLMTVIGYVASPLLIGMMTPPADVAEGAIIYLQIIFLGILGGAAYNILSGVLRGLGDSIFPLLYLVISSLLNIVLDLLFVRNLNMGIAGVAWATIISQGISGALCVVRLCTMKDVVTVDRKTIRGDKSLIVRLCKLGLPAGITQVIFSCSAIVVQSLINSMGTAVIAANVAVMRVDGFAMMPNFTFGITATTYMGQNVGAMKADRIKKGTHDLLLLAFGVAFVLVVGIVVFGYNLIHLFSSTEEVIAIGRRGLYWLSVGYLAFSVSQVLQGEMRGAGETVIPMWISIITTVAMRLPLAYVLAYFTKSEVYPGGHPDSIFASLLITWLLGTLITVFLFKKGVWKRTLPKELKEQL